MAGNDLDELTRLAFLLLDGGGVNRERRPAAARLSWRTRVEPIVTAERGP